MGKPSFFSQKADRGLRKFIADETQEVLDEIHGKISYEEDSDEDSEFEMAYELNEFYNSNDASSLIEELDNRSELMTNSM